MPDTAGDQSISLSSPPAVFLPGGVCDDWHMRTVDILTRELALVERATAVSDAVNRGGRLCPALDETTASPDPWDGKLWGGICSQCQCRVPMGEWLCESCHSKQCDCMALHVRMLRRRISVLGDSSASESQTQIQRAARESRRLWRAETGR